MMAGQLLRSGTSPYGNHGEVESAESRKDFIHKLEVCLKELKGDQTLVAALLHALRRCPVPAYSGRLHK